jgi:hypothetical protein
MTRKLYIHIGCHKTGTTSIQHTLARNPAALARRNLSFFYENYASGELLLPDLHSWLEYLERYKVVPHGLRGRDPLRLATRLSELSGDIILSSENFSFFFEQQHIDALHAALAPVFADIRVICYLRRQDRHIVSHHQEGSKLMRRAENDLYGYSAKAIPAYDPRHRLYLDYERRLSMWAKVFGDERMVLKVYDRKLLKNGDAVADFFQLLGVDQYDKVGDRNSAVGFIDSKLGHLILGSDAANKEMLVDVAKAAGPDRRRMLPSRAEAQAYYAHFAESNAALNARFHINAAPQLFDDDFSDYPEAPQDEWTEESANDALTRLLVTIDRRHARELDSLYPKLSVKDLRDAAIEIGKTRPDVAVRLLRVALTLRPEGRMIRQTLADFEKALAQK